QASAAADNLGNHTATTDLDLATNKLVGNGGTEGLVIDAAGNVGIGTVAPAVELDVNTGVINASAICDESNSNCIDLSVGATAASVKSVAANPGVGNVAGDVVYNTTDNIAYVYNGTAWGPLGDSGGSADNLGNHTATANIELAGNWLSNDGDNEGVFVDTAGNVGIGTTAPGSKLHVEGITIVSESVDNSALTGLPPQQMIVGNLEPVDGGASLIQLNTVNGSSAFATAWIGNVSEASNHASSLIFANEDPINPNVITERMRIAASGNVGIGTTAPDKPLHVKSTFGSAAQFERTDGANVIQLSRTNENGAGLDSTPVQLQYVAETSTDGVVESIGSLRFKMDTASQGLIDSSFEVLNYENGVVQTPFVINSSGNVGIGTTNPDTTLDVGTGSINAAEICDESNANCIDLSVGASAASVNSGGTNPGSATQGDVFYNTGDDVAYIYNGTAWEPMASSGSSDAVLTDADPATNLTGAVEGDIAFNSTSDRLQVYDGSSWVDVDGSNGDDLGDHTATQNIELGSNRIVNGGTAGIRVNSLGHASVGDLAPLSTAALRISPNDDSAQDGIVIRTHASNADILFSDSGVIAAEDNMTFNIDSDNDNPDTAGFTFAKNSKGNASTALVKITEEGNVGIGTASPGEALVVGDHAFSFHNGGHRVLAFDSEYNDLAGDWERQGGAAYQGQFGFNPNTGSAYIRSSSIDGASGTFDNFFLDMVGSTGNVGINTNAPDSKLHVEGDVRAAGEFTVADAGITPDHLNDNSAQVGLSVTPGGQLKISNSMSVPLIANRKGDDGHIIQLRQGGNLEGTISVSGSTVSYNAFTGSHYARLKESLEKGRLVSFRGRNIYNNNNTESEIIYGAVETSKANDSKVLGAYLGVEEGGSPRSDKNPDLIMAVGNGVMWVADKGEDVSIGDYLISSSTKGHAMKDPETYPVSYIVARAAESVNWDEVISTFEGVKHKRISVTYEAFTKESPNYYEKLAAQNYVKAGHISGMETLLKLNPVQYVWENSAEKEEKGLGFIASEVSKVDPQLVDYESSNVDKPSRVRLSGMVALITKAFHELFERVEKIFSKTEVLDTQVAELKRQNDVLREKNQELEDRMNRIEQILINSRQDDSRVPASIEGK
ncbi:MAG: hypothetical protein ACRBBP_10690, partial [Bdellovibrionales bacterium]